MLALLLARVQVCVEPDGELVEDGVHATGVELVLRVALGCDFVQFGAVQRLVDLNQFVFDSGQRIDSVGLQLEDLVWKDLVLLECKCLHLSSWEPLNNPRLLFFFASLDLRDNQIGYNLIVNELVAFEGALYGLAELTLLNHFFPQDVAEVDANPACELV